MAFDYIDVAQWDRREVYRHYIDDVACSYSATVDIDVTPLQGEKLYPAMLWLLTDTVNAFAEFRTQYTPGGVGVFDSMHPSYTIFNRETERFSVIWTAFDPDYRVFLGRYTEDVETYRRATAFFPKPGMPENIFDVSMIPWFRFSAFNLNIHGGGKHLLPIFTMGKTHAAEGRTLLPLSIQVHHAVCDGFHLARFLDALQTRISAFQPRGAGDASPPAGR